MHLNITNLYPEDLRVNGFCFLKDGLKNQPSFGLNRCSLSVNGQKIFEVHDNKFGSDCVYSCVLVGLNATSEKRASSISILTTQIATIYNQTMSIANYISQRFLTLEEIGIDKVFVINRDIRIDRLSHVSKLLDYLKLPFTRFPAIDAGKFLHQIDRFDPRTKFLQNIFNINDTNRKRAIWQSHLQVYFKIINEVSVNDRPVLIFEDDIDLEANAPSLLKEALQSLPNDWEMFLLDHSHMNCKRVYPNNICRAHTFYCASAYVVRNLTVTRKLINWSNTEAPQGADAFWRPYIRNGSLIVYAAYPNHIAIQYRSKFGSDVPQSGPIKVVNLRNPLSKILQEYKLVGFIPSFRSDLLH